MSLIPHDKLNLFNANLLNESPDEIIRFVLQLSNSPVLTTSFGRFSEVIIEAVNKEDPNLQVLWCDTGYNSPQTYQHSDRLKTKYDLNLRVVSPKFSTAYSEYHWGKPDLDNPQHEKLTQVLKLDPIKEAFSILKPDLWITNIRKGQTAFRDELDVLSLSPEGILKVSPFYHWTDDQLRAYMERKGLTENTNYFDPIKALSKRECGIHFSN